MCYENSPITKEKDTMLSHLSLPSLLPMCLVLPSYVQAETAFSTSVVEIVVRAYNCFH
jgi:hypothetical protein